MPLPLPLALPLQPLPLALQRLPLPLPLPLGHWEQVTLGRQLSRIQRACYRHQPQICHVLGPGYRRQLLQLLQPLRQLRVLLLPLQRLGLDLRPRWAAACRVSCPRLSQLPQLPQLPPQMRMTGGVSRGQLVAHQA